jgi:hypothetical protein
MHITNFEDSSVDVGDISQLVIGQGKSGAGWQTKIRRDEDQNKVIEELKRKHQARESQQQTSKRHQ